jgi:hypothetical protein
MIYPPMKFQVDTSNTFWDILRTKMSDGRTYGRTETIYIPPPAFRRGIIIPARVWQWRHCFSWRSFSRHAWFLCRLEKGDT